MRALRNFLVAMTAVGSLYCASAIAQESGKPEMAAPNLAGQLSGVNFFVSEGRIQAVANGVEVEREETDTLGRHEKLSISADGDQFASINYELSDAGGKLTVEVVDGRQITISRAGPAGSPSALAEFRQPREGPLELTVTSGDTAKGTTVKYVKGPTIWHLLLTEPELCRKNLLPLLEMLRGDWRLVETAQSIESQMMRKAEAYRPENLQRWATMVADLGSDHFSVRHAADRQLRGAGTAVIPYLQSLDANRLDFEQWSQIQMIIAAQNWDAQDTPDTVASRSMADRQLWLIFLGRPQESTRRIAVQQMNFLMGGPISFDPAGDDATRHRQLESLHAKIEADAAKDAKST